MHDPLFDQVRRAPNPLAALVVLMLLDVLVDGPLECSGPLCDGQPTQGYKCYECGESYIAPRSRGDTHCSYCGAEVVAILRAA